MTHKYINYESSMSQKLTSCEIQKRLPIGLPSTNENIYGSIRDCQVQGYSDKSQETIGGNTLECIIII